MKAIKIETHLKIYDSINELPKDIKMLASHASQARLKAYAPYSKFNVGAAILLDNGEIVTGSNQENACYPSGLCAERTAIYYAGSKYPESKLLKLVIIAGPLNGEANTPVPPCGACRQAILEYEIKQDSNIEIYFMGTSGKVVQSNSLANLLPLGFDSSFL